MIGLAEMLRECASAHCYQRNGWIVEDFLCWFMPGRHDCNCPLCREYREIIQRIEASKL